MVAIAKVNRLQVYSKRNSQMRSVRKMLNFIMLKQMLRIVPLRFQVLIINIMAIYTCSLGVMVPISTVATGDLSVA
jgi:hypothetical protein